MKIADLKQPYRRMAEYLGKLTTYKGDIRYDIYSKIVDGNHPPITEEIKKHFPPDFDFSEKDEYPNNQCDDACYYYCTEGGKIKPKCINEKYTQLAREGKFDQLPDTCEFSEAVEMLVKDFDDKNPQIKSVVGKYKSKYVTEGKEFFSGFAIWNYAQLPPKIDFSQFKNGDIVEIVTINNYKIYGLLFSQNFGEISLTFSYQSDKAKNILKEDIISITKIK